MSVCALRGEVALALASFVNGFDPDLDHVLFTCLCYYFLRSRRLRILSKTLAFLALLVQNDLYLLRLWHKERWIPGAQNESQCTL